MLQARLDMRGGHITGNATLSLMSRPMWSSHLLGGLTASFSHGYVYPMVKSPYVVIIGEAGAILGRTKGWVIVLHAASPYRPFQTWPEDVMTSFLEVLRNSSKLLPPTVGNVDTAICQNPLLIISNLLIQERKRNGHSFSSIGPWGY